MILRQSMKLAQASLSSRSWALSSLSGGSTSSRLPRCLSHCSRSQPALTSPSLVVRAWQTTKSDSSASPPQPPPPPPPPSTEHNSEATASNTPDDFHVTKAKGMPSSPEANASPSSSPVIRTTSGHIETGPGEHVLFFDNLFPRRISPLLLRRPFQSLPDEREITELLKRFESTRLGAADPIRQLKRSLPPDSPVDVTQILLRLKEGGAFVKFKCSPSTTPNEFEAKLQKFQKANPVKPWFSPFRGIRAYLVRGEPWIEDLFRFPKCRLKVEFMPADPEGLAIELSQEQLYNLFRRYGKIADIVGQPSDSKVTPRYAFVDFAHTRDAIMARNCMHGLVVDHNHGGGKWGTLLRLVYEDRPKSNKMWGWINNHPRLAIPLLAALAAAITAALFDPIRTFFVQLHIEQTLDITRYQAYRWFNSQTRDLLPQTNSKKKGQESLGTLWGHRKEIVKKIQSWLLEAAENVIIVQGPRGSGKKELVVDLALGERSNVLVLDIGPVAEARGESTTIRKLAQAVGYKPIFSWANNMSSLIDLAVQSTTGVKSGFSETFGSQIDKILHTTSTALKRTALKKRRDRELDANLSDDVWLEAHPELRPVVVIDNYLSTPSSGTSAGGNKDEAATMINNKIAEWASMMMHGNIAHVIFLAEDNAVASKSLSKVMPDRGTKIVTLGDLRPDVAKQYIMGHIEEAFMADQNDPSKDTTGATLRGGKISDDSDHQTPPSAGESEQMVGPATTTQPFKWFNANRRTKEDEKELNDRITREKEEMSQELDYCIPILGGRLSDLELLARRIRSGQRPRDAVQEIIDDACSDLLKTFVLAGRKADDRKWSPEQAWCVIKKLASTKYTGRIRYNEVVVDGEFTSCGISGVSPEDALESLVADELVSVANGPPTPRLSASRTMLDPSAVSSPVADTTDEIYPSESKLQPVATWLGWEQERAVEPTKITPGRPVYIQPGRPVYNAAFRALMKDKALKARMQLAVLKQLSAAALADIEKSEKSLAILYASPGAATEKGMLGMTKKTDRVKYLEQRIEKKQWTLATQEGKIDWLKKQLGTFE